MFNDRLSHQLIVGDELKLVQGRPCTNSKELRELTKDKTSVRVTIHRPHLDKAVLPTSLNDVLLELETLEGNYLRYLEAVPDTSLSRCRERGEGVLKQVRFLLAQVREQLDAEQQLRKAVRNKNLLAVGKALQRTGISTAATHYWTRDWPIPPITLSSRSLSFKHDLVEAQTLAIRAHEALNNMCECLLQEQARQRSWEEQLWVNHLSDLSAAAAAKRRQRRVEPPVIMDYELAKIHFSGKLAVRSIPRSRDAKAITLHHLPNGTEVKLVCKVCSTDSPTWFAEIHPFHDNLDLWKGFEKGFVPYENLRIIQSTDQRASAFYKKISDALTAGMAAGVKVSNTKVLQSSADIGGLFAKYVSGWHAIKSCMQIVECDVLESY